MAHPAYDITFCPGVDCPLRDRCWRFRAERPARFDSFGHSPFNPTTGTCDAYWEVDDEASPDKPLRQASEG